DPRVDGSLRSFDHLRRLGIRRAAGRPGVGGFRGWTDLYFSSQVGDAVVRWAPRDRGGLRVCLEAGRGSGHRERLRLRILSDQGSARLQQGDDQGSRHGRRQSDGRADAAGDPDRAGRVLPPARVDLELYARPALAGREVRQEVGRGRQPRRQRDVQAAEVGARPGAHDRGQSPVLGRQADAAADRLHADRRPVPHQPAGVREQRARRHGPDPAGRHRAGAERSRPEQAAAEVSPDRPRELLAEAGYPDGKGFQEGKLASGKLVTFDLVAQPLQQIWRDTLKINVTLQRIERKEYNAAFNSWAKQPYDAYIDRWGSDFEDPANWANILFDSDQDFFHTRWHNAEFDSLIRKGAGEADPAKRRQLYESAEKILN